MKSTIRKWFLIISAIILSILITLFLSVNYIGNLRKESGQRLKALYEPKRQEYLAKQPSLEIPQMNFSNTQKLLEERGFEFDRLHIVPDKNSIWTRSTKNHAYPSDIWIEYSLTATLSASENILEILLDIDPRKHLISSPEENIPETIFQILDDAAELPYFESNPTKLKAWIRETLPNLKPGEKIGPMDAPKSELIVGPAKYELSIWRSPEKETSHIIRLHIIKSAP